MALLDFVPGYRVNRQQKGKTRKVKPICIYWSNSSSNTVALSWTIWKFTP